MPLKLLVLRLRTVIVGRFRNRKMLSQHMDANAEISLVLHKNLLM